MTGDSSLIGSRIRVFHWYRKWRSLMTLNGVMAVILRYFTAFRSFGASYTKVVEISVIPSNSGNLFFGNV